MIDIHVSCHKLSSRQHRILNFDTTVILAEQPQKLRFSSTFWLVFFLSNWLLFRLRLQVKGNKHFQLVFLLNKDGDSTLR